MPRSGMTSVIPNTSTSTMRKMGSIRRPASYTRGGHLAQAIRARDRRGVTQLASRAGVVHRHLLADEEERGVGKARAAQAKRARRRVAKVGEHLHDGVGDDLGRR